MTTLNAEKVKNERTPGQYADGQYGLVLRVGTSGKKTWVVRARQRGGGSQTVKLGTFPALPLAQAREKARNVFNALTDGANPNEERRKEKATAKLQLEEEEAAKQKNDWTLSKAVETYCEVMHLRAEETKRSYRHLTHRHLPDWLDRPMSEVTQLEIQQKHKELRETKTHNIANQTMNVLSAIYAFSMKQPGPDGMTPRLAHNPVTILRRQSLLQKPKPRTDIIVARDMPRWYREVTALKDETLRDYALFLWLTGVRAKGAATLQWSNVDFARKCYTVKNKGKGRGEEWLTLPMGEYIYRLLKTRQKSVSGKYVFQNSIGGPYQLAYVDFGELVKWRKMLNWRPHTMRRTFATCAGALLPPYAVKALLGHSSQSDITAQHYVHFEARKVREFLQQVEDELLRQAGVKHACS